MIRMSSTRFGGEVGRYQDLALSLQKSQPLMVLPLILLAELRWRLLALAATSRIGRAGADETSKINRHL